MAINMRNIWLMAVGLILIGLLGMSYYKFDFTIVNKDRVEVERRWQFAAGELAGIDLAGASMNMQVEFVPSGSRYIEIRGSVREHVAKQIESAGVAKGIFTMNASPKREWHFFSLNFMGQKIYVTVAMPEEEILETVRLNLRSGNGNYQSVIGQNIQIGSSSGNISFKDLAAIGEISVTGGSGNIKGSGISGDVKLSLRSGNITVDGLNGNVAVESRSGNVNITQKTAGSADIDSRSGNVTFTVAADYAGYYDLRASSGRIREPEHRPALTQDVVKARTRSGNITVKKP